MRIHRTSLLWAGGLLTATAVIGLGIHFLDVGLDRADKLASAIGVLVALAGLGVAVYGLVRPGTGEPATPPSHVRMSAKAGGNGQVFQAGGDQHIGEPGPRS